MYRDNHDMHSENAIMCIGLFIGSTVSILEWIILLNCRMIMLWPVFECNHVCVCACVRTIR